MWNKKNYYILINLILPLLGCLFLALLGTYLIEDISINIFIGIIKINKLGFFGAHVTLFILLFLFLRYIYISKFQNEKKELIPSTIYSNIPYFIYAFAAFTLKIKNINLKLKPASLQFKILHHANLFEIEDIPYIKEEEVQYDLLIDNKSSKVINLVIADTYSFDNINLPKSVTNNTTYIISRKDKETNRKRLNSRNLIDLVIKIVEENKNNHNEYNLFLFTNPKTNWLLFNDVFNTSSDNFRLNVFDYNKNKCVFSEEPQCIIKNL